MPNKTITLGVALNAQEQTAIARLCGHLGLPTTHAGYVLAIRVALAALVGVDLETGHHDPEEDTAPYYLNFPLGQEDARIVAMVHARAAINPTGRGAVKTALMFAVYTANFEHSLEQP